jgi:hypothetical protein
MMEASSEEKEGDRDRLNEEEKIESECGRRGRIYLLPVLFRMHHNWG